MRTWEVLCRGSPCPYRYQGGKPHISAGLALVGCGVKGFKVPLIYSSRRIVRQRELTSIPPPSYLLLSSFLYPLE